MPTVFNSLGGCGHCARCAEGEENICEEQVAAPGGGCDGGMADYIIVDNVRHLIPLGTLDPVTAAPLLCAGLTTYHAIKNARSKLVPGSTAILIGIGGLGHLAIQIIRALSPARIIAVDAEQSKLTHAIELGAHDTVLAGPDAAQSLRSLTKDLGANLVLDMVGTDETLKLAQSVLARKGVLTLIGAVGGVLPLRFMEMPRDSSVVTPCVGTLPDLLEVIALTASDLIRPEIERIGFAGLADGYARMKSGKLRGRAVLVPSI